MADQDLVNQNFAADIDALKASNAALIQKIAEDESNLNQESFQKCTLYGSIGSIHFRGIRIWSTSRFSMKVKIEQNMFKIPIDP